MAAQFLLNLFITFLWVLLKDEDVLRIQTVVTGFIVGGTGSFAIGFVVAGAVLLIGIFSYLFLLGGIEQIKSPFGENSSVNRVK